MMISDLIKEEKDKLNKLLTRIKELKKELNELESKKNSVENELNDVQNIFYKLNSRLSALRKYQEPSKFNMLQKFLNFLFKHKEYIKHLNEDKHRQQSIQKDKDEYERVENMIRELQEKRGELEKKISKLQLQLNAYNTDEIRAKYDKLMTADIQQQLEFLIFNNSNLTSNIEFMIEAIRINPRNIQYDKTDDEELYKLFFKERMRQISNNHRIDNNDKEYLLEQYQKSLEELENPKEVEKGKYKIPHKYFFESIREFEKIFDAECKNGCVLGCGLLRNNPLSGKECYAFTSKYLDYDGFFDEEYGKQIQSLFENEKSYLAIHGSNTGNEELMKKIMKEGLKGTHHKVGPLSLSGTALYGKELSFFDALSYRTNQYCAILLVPKAGLEETDRPIKIWGTNEKDPINYYCLPEFVFGYMDPDTEGSRRIIINDHSQDKTYKYTYYDSSLKMERGDVVGLDY